MAMLVYKATTLLTIRSSFREFRECLKAVGFTSDVSVMLAHFSDLDVIVIVMKVFFTSFNLLLA